MKNYASLIPVIEPVLIDTGSISVHAKYKRRSVVWHGDILETSQCGSRLDAVLHGVVFGHDSAETRWHEVYVLQPSMNVSVLVGKGLTFEFLINEFEVLE